MNFLKDSFDRFGDDLCEELLRYLPLSDCFYFQCVNKQFKTFIFKKQTKLVLIDNYGENRIRKIIMNNHVKLLDYEYDSSTLEITANNNEFLKYVLIKCENIIDLNIYFDLCINDESIDIISNAVKCLKHLSLNGFYCKITLECWQRFAKKKFEFLETLKIYNNFFMNTTTTLLHFTPNLKSLEGFNLKEVFSDLFHLNKHHFIKKIESFNYYFICDENFIIFTKYYKHCLKTLVVKISNTVNTDFLKHLAYFEKLETLYCKFDYIDYDCVEILKQIGLKCIKLRLLIIYRLNKPFYRSFLDGYKLLEILSIKEKDCVCEKILLLKNCKNLKKLKFEYCLINESDFKDISLYLPKLNTISFNFCFILNSKTFNNIIHYHLSFLSNLITLNLHMPELYEYEYDINITDSIIYLITNCLSIRRIGLYGFLNYKQKFKYILKYIKEKNRKIILKFEKNYSAIFKRDTLSHKNLVFC